MKYPKPFVISLMLFMGLTIAAFAWRSGASHSLLSERNSRPPRSNPAAPPPPANAPVPSAEEILLMSTSELRNAAAAWIGGKDPADMHRSMLICSRLAELDPDHGIQPLLALLLQKSSGSSTKGFLEIAAFLSTWLADDQRDPAALLKNVTGSQEKQLLTDSMGLAAMMMGLNPRTTAKLSAALAADAADIPARILAAQAESAVSPDDALAKLMALPESADQKSAIHFIVRNALDTDPHQALRLAGRVPFEGDIPVIMGRALEKLVKDRPTAALDYILSHPGPARTTAFLDRCGPLLAAAGPDALRTATDSLDDPGLRSALIAHAAAALALTDPSAAAGLMGGLELNEMVMPLWEKVATAHARLPEAEQEKWLAGQPPGPARDAAVTALALERLRTGTPSSALSLLQHVADPQANTLTLASLVEAWKSKDAPAAEAWLQQQSAGIRNTLQPADTP